MWTEAILRGHEMTATHDGVKGVDRLKNDIKMVINSGGNILINQHSDCGRTDKILRDTSKCEFIVVCDNMMTASCRYADVLLRIRSETKPKTSSATATRWAKPRLSRRSIKR